jgi:hypothetical protein
VDNEQVSENFVQQLEGHLASSLKEKLANLRHNTPSSSYADGTPLFASGQNVVHDRLAKNGLLDDAEFCREFGIFLHDIAFGVLFELLTLHDGSWELDEDREYQIHIKDGEPLVEYLHELSNDPAPIPL